jgi:hypothetical protein
LFQVSDAYSVRGKGELQNDGERPGPTWHTHGYLVAPEMPIRHSRIRDWGVRVQDFMDAIETIPGYTASHTYEGMSNQAILRIRL